MGGSGAKSALQSSLLSKAARPITRFFQPKPRSASTLTQSPAGGSRLFSSYRSPRGSRRHDGAGQTILEEDNDENLRFREDVLKNLLDKGKAEHAETQLRNWRKHSNPTQQTLIYMIESSIKSKEENHLRPAIHCLEELADFSTSRMHVRGQLTELLQLALEASVNDAKFKPHRRIIELGDRLGIKLVEDKKEENTNHRSRNQGTKKKANKNKY